MGKQELAITPDREAQFDEALSKLPCFETQHELRLSPLLPADFILARNYQNSFPQHSMTVGSALNASEQYLLSPTCCYPIFRHYSSSELPDPMLVTSKSLCFRSETHYQVGERQSCFAMREYVLFSTNLEYVRSWAEQVKLEVVSLLGRMGLSAKVEKASDPFFNPNEFKQMFQENQSLKHEFIVDETAVGSVNLHMKSFSKSCKITARNGEYFYSACVGLGYDRLAAKLGSAEPRRANET